VQPDQREPPEAVGAKHLVGPQPEQEVLELVEAVERRHRSGERARRGPEDPAHPRPELALADAPEKAQLQQDAVDRAAGEDERDVPLVAHLHRMHYD
jgi:hypothetical protein